MKHSILIKTAILALLFTLGCGTVEKYDLEFTLSAPASFSPKYEMVWDDISSVLQSRIRSFGIEDENISVTVNKPEFIVAIKGTDTTELNILKGLLTLQGKMEFWETYENSEVFAFLTEDNSELKLKIIENSLNSEDTTLNNITDPAEIPSIDSVAKGFSLFDELKNTVPFYSQIIPNISPDGIPNKSCLVGYALANDTSSVSAFLNDSFPSSLPNDIIFCWSEKPAPFDSEGRLFELHALRSSGNHQKYILDGSVIVKSGIEGGRNTSLYFLNIEMNHEGATVFAGLTGRSTDRCIALLMDGKVIAYPRVMSVIEDGKIQITSDLDINELRILSCILNSFPKVLPVKLEIGNLSINKH
jgi:SecD/SecF fusion protein